MLRWFLLMLAIFAGATLSVTADQSRPEFDQSGKGAVICVWSIYVDIQQGIELCDLPPMAGDEDLAPSIRRVEEFILEHTTRGVTQAMLDSHKSRTYEQSKQALSTQSDGLCETVKMLREKMVGNLVAATDDLLSVPREPLWNPCI